MCDVQCTIEMTLEEHSHIGQRHSGEASTLLFLRYVTTQGQTPPHLELVWRSESLNSTIHLHHVRKEYYKTKKD